MGDDDDLAFALFLQEQLNNENSEIVPQKQSNVPTCLVDQAWELIDPNPDIRQLFLQFNQEYFDGMLGGVEVRWSPRMTLCAGLCCYEGRGGLCSIRLSEPLLKLRPRKDLVETLLHEMIHALLFVTQNNKDHDGHGPEFHKHMYRINKQAGTNISVYHNFHDEVNAYRQHWWKCNGPCQKWPPFYGVVKRAMNRAPAPRDTWWDDHKRKCGGEFTKVKEPENYGKRKSKKKDNVTVKGKGKSANSDSKPNLPTFFDKMKKIQTSDNSHDVIDKKTTSECEEDMFGSNSSDDNLESSTKKPKIDNSLPPGFQVFTGKGHVLGGSKTIKVEQNRVPNPLGVHNTNDKLKCKAGTSSNQRDSTSSLNLKKGSYNSKVSKKKTDIPSLTIIDAFARSKTAEEDSAAGSKDKPINLCDDSSNEVPCPSCQSSIPLHMINNHLDTCLASA